MRAKDRTMEVKNHNKDPHDKSNGGDDHNVDKITEALIAEAQKAQAPNDLFCR